MKKLGVKAFLFCILVVTGIFLIGGVFPNSIQLSDGFDYIISGLQPQSVQAGHVSSMGIIYDAGNPKRIEGLGSPSALYQNEWDWDDGTNTTSSSAIVPHTYISDGTYQVTLVVRLISDGSVDSTFTRWVTIPHPPFVYTPPTKPLDFGSIASGASKTESFTVKNTAGVPGTEYKLLAAPSWAKITGLDAAQFAYVCAGSGTTQFLPPGATKTCSVTFNAPVVAVDTTYNATLELVVAEIGGFSSETDIDLTGVALGGAAVLTLDFKARESGTLNPATDPVTIPDGSPLDFYFDHGGFVAGPATLRIDCDGDGAFDETLPVANILANDPHTASGFCGGFYTAPGPYTARGKIEQGVGFVEDTIDVNVAPPPVVTVDIKANGFDGPITVPDGSIVTRTWTTTGSPTSCTASVDWGPGPKPVANGPDATLPLLGPVTNTYFLSCDDGVSFATDSVVVNVSAPGVFTVSSITPDPVTETVLPSPLGFEATIIVPAAGVNVVSCALWVDGATKGGMVNAATGSSFSVVGSECPPSSTCTARHTSFTFSVGDAATSPHSVKARCVDAVFTTIETPTMITVLSFGAIPPTADFTFTVSGLDVTVTDASTPGTNPISPGGTWVWDYDDASTDVGIGPHTHTYAVSGTYNVKLTVTDSGGFSDTVTRSVTVGGGCVAAPGIISFCNPISATSFTEVINTLTNFLFTLAVIIAPILLVVAGVIFMTAAGDPGRISMARRMLIWTIVGFGVILLSKGLVSVLGAILGI